MRIVGLDLSLTSTGVATPSGTQTVKSRAKGMERLYELRRAALDYAMDPERAGLVVIEGYSMGTQRQASHAHALGELGGVVRLALWERGLPYVDVPPATLKRFATGKGNAPKDQVLVAAVKRSGIEFATNDEADAWWLRALACEAYGEPIVDVPAAQRAVVSAVSWPLSESSPALI